MPTNPTARRGTNAGMLTREYIARVMRGVQQEMEALDELAEPSVEELSKAIREM